MNTRNIIDKAKELNSIIKEHEPFFAALQNLSNLYNEINKIIFSFDTNKLDSSKVNQLNSSYKKTSNCIKSTINPLLFLRSVDDLQKYFMLLNTELGAKDSQIKQISVFLTEFLQTYEAYFSSHMNNIETAQKLILNAQRLLMLIRSFQESFTLIANQLISSEPLREDEAEFMLVLDTEITFKEFLSKLNSIKSIYFEFCFLFKINETEFPVKIKKIESGSLLSDLIGNKEVITAMIVLIAAVANYFYRNYTKEGQFMSLPKKFETLDKALKLTEKWEKRGIDTSKIKDNIEKSAVKISSDIKELLYGIPHFTLNEKEYSINQEFEKKYLEESKRKLLENNISDCDKNDKK